MSTMTDWSPGEHLARVLHEEQLASEMAAAMEEVVESGNAARLAAELDRFHAFLVRELEIHFAKEEADLFPVLARRGLEIEVAEAKRQHGEIRRLRAQLTRDCGDAERVRAALGELGRRLKRHICYEADCLYVDLRKAEAEEYRADIEAALADSAGG